MSATNTATVVEDFLDEDAEISGQKYVLLSFLSPENVLENKDRFFFNKFLHSFEVDWKVKSLEKFLADTFISANRELDKYADELEKEGQSGAAEICRKRRLNVENVMDTYKEFVQKQSKDINNTKIEECWDDFMFKERTKLEDEFHAANEFRTTIRGLKVRGVYGNSKEAEGRAKKLQAKDKYHNILLGEVGKWLPWDPSPQNIASQEYSEERLNTIMQKYKENEDTKEKFFEERKNKSNGSKTDNTKKVFGVVASEESGTTDKNANSVVDTSVDTSTSHSSLFDSPGDLAISRKLGQSESVSFST